MIQLATIPVLASTMGIVSFYRFTVVSLAFAFLLSFPFLSFLTFSFGALYLPDVHRRRRVWSRVPPKIVVGSLCQCRRRRPQNHQQSAPQCIADGAHEENFAHGFGRAVGVGATYPIIDAGAA